MRIEFNSRTKRDALKRADGRCENPKCGAFLSLNKYHYDHRIAAKMGGDASLENCQVLCFACHGVKTKDDVGKIAQAKRRSDRHNGIRKPSRFQGSRDSRWKKKVSGEVVPR